MNWLLDIHKAHSYKNQQGLRKMKQGSRGQPGESHATTKHWLIYLPFTAPKPEAVLFCYCLQLSFACSSCILFSFEEKLEFRRWLQNWQIWVFIIPTLFIFLKCSIPGISKSKIKSNFKLFLFFQDLKNILFCVWVQWAEKDTLLLFSNGPLWPSWICWIWIIFLRASRICVAAAWWRQCLNLAISP